MSLTHGEISDGQPRPVTAQAENPSLAGAAAQELVPGRLLDGGEVVILAIKPSLWYILIWSFRWIIAAGLIVSLLLWQAPRWTTISTMLLVQTVLGLLCLRLAWTTLQWVSRLYVLTNRRVMRIRGIFNVDIFECELHRIQNTYLRLTWYERLLRLGTIDIATAGTGLIESTWYNVSRPLDVHEELRRAIARARRGDGSP